MCVYCGALMEVRGQLVGNVWDLGLNSSHHSKHLLRCSDLFSVTMTNTVPGTHLGGRRFIWLICGSPSTEGSQWRRVLAQKAGRSAAGLLPRDCFLLQLRAGSGTAHSGLGLPLSFSDQEKALQTCPQAALGSRLHRGPSSLVTPACVKLTEANEDTF